MNQTATLNLFDYFIEIGTQFFQLEEKDLNYYQDDLNYEENEKEGLNGYLLKIEEQTSNYNNIMLRFLISIFHNIQTFFKVKDSESAIGATPKRKAVYNTQAHIHQKVRSRLLEVINEDVDMWNLTSSSRRYGRTKRVLKNQFKDPMRE